jgi:predicted site-specific integrase-resolvase
MFLPIRDALTLTGIGSQTLRRLFDDNILEGYKTQFGSRMYSRQALLKFCETNTSNENKAKSRINFIYARVSTKKQFGDLARQVEFLQTREDRYSNYTIIQDIGSGVNFKRKGLLEILDACLHGIIGELVVAHRDRLSRFAFDLIKTIITKAGGKLTVIGDEIQKSTEQELAEDLLSIVHIYSCRQLGKRRYKRVNGENSIDSAKIDGEPEDTDRSEFTCE